MFVILASHGNNFYSDYCCHYLVVIALQLIIGNYTELHNFGRSSKVDFMVSVSTSIFLLLSRFASF